MNTFILRTQTIPLVITVLLLPACSTPSLVQMARRDNNANKDDVTARYTITDRDVLNYTDEVKRKLANRGNFHMGLRYGSATAQTSLSGLAGAASALGWAASSASLFGMGATYIFGLGQIFGAKDHAQAYETAASAISKAEAAYYLNQVGYEVGTDKKIHRVQNGDDRSSTGSATPSLMPSGAIPRSDCLTIDGETLYYRVTKTLKVLDDALAEKIPNLQDLKDSQGDNSGTPKPPVTPTPSPSAKATL